MKNTIYIGEKASIVVVIYIREYSNKYFCSFNSFNASGSTLLTSNTGKKFGTFLKCRIIFIFSIKK